MSAIVDARRHESSRPLPRADTSSVRHFAEFSLTECGFGGRDGYPSTVEQNWEVVVAGSSTFGDPQDIKEEILMRGSEDEARRVYVDRTADAAERGHAYVKLRRDGTDVETWPQRSGWTV